MTNVKIYSKENDAKSYELKSFIEIENHLNFLTDLSKEDENIFHLCESVSCNLSSLKRDFFDKQDHLRKVNDFSQIAEKPTRSILSISDPNMTINDRFHASKDYLIDKSLFDQNSDCKHEIDELSKEAGTNTELKLKHQDVQTSSNKRDPDATHRSLYFQGQAKELQKLVLTLNEKGNLVLAKCQACFDQLNRVQDQYRHQLKKVSCDNTNVAVETCESWVKKWDKMVADNKLFSDMVLELTLALEKKNNCQIQLKSAQTDKNKYLMEIADLSKRKDKLTHTKEVLIEDIFHSKNKNEFLNMERQCLQVALEQMEIDWPKALESCLTQVKQSKSKLRNENIDLEIDKLRLRDQLMDENLNSGGKYNVIYWKEQQNILLNQFSKFHDLCSGLERDAMDLKRKILILEDSRVAHSIEKRMWLPQRQRMQEELRDGNDVLNKRINLLNTVVKEVKLDNEQIHSQLEAYASCMSELTHEMSSDLGDSEECANRLREILDKYHV